MDLGNTTTNLGYGMSRMPYQPNIKINKIYDDAHLPTYGSKYAACADLYAYIGSDDAMAIDKDGNNCIMIQLRCPPVCAWLRRKAGMSLSMLAVVWQPSRVWLLRTKQGSWIKITVGLLLWHYTIIPISLRRLLMVTALLRWRLFRSGRLILKKFPNWTKPSAAPARLGVQV